MHATNAALYGKGIFTTVAIYDRKPFLWQKHWQRLTDNASKIGIDLSEHSREATRKSLHEIIEKKGVLDGRARITFSDESPSSIWSTNKRRKTKLSIITADLRTVPDNFKLTISPYPVNSLSPLAGVKSCNYLENILALDYAKTRGLDEAVRLNEYGHVTSGCMSNIFWLKDGVIYTPGLLTGCIAGTTRGFVIDRLKCTEVEAELEELIDVDAIFLTSAGLGIVAIDEFAGRKLKRPDHPLLELI